MIWVYIVAMTMTSPVTENNTFIVHAPNMAFKNEKDCQQWREIDMLRLFNTRPDANAKAVSMCISLPFNIDKDA